MFTTDYAVPAGEFIEEWLEDNGVSQAQLAKLTGVSPKHVSTVVQGKAGISPQFAVKLGQVTGVPAERWIALEAQYGTDRARLEEQKKLARETELIKTLKPSAKYLKNMGAIQSTGHAPGRQIWEIMQVFRVATADALRDALRMPQAQYLQSSAHAVHEASVATWLCLAKRTAENSEPLPEFNIDRLRAALPHLRELSRDLPEKNPLGFVDVLQDVGVRVIRQAEVDGCRTHGATFWTNGTPVIVLTDRYKRIGTTWFSLFHELGHVLLHRSNGDHVHEEPESADDEVIDEQEEEANRFAEDTLIPPELRERLHRVRSIQGLEHIAQDEGVHPAVLLHNLHHHEMWPRRNGNGLSPSFSILSP